MEGLVPAPKSEDAGQQGPTLERSLQLQQLQAFFRSSSGLLTLAIRRGKSIQDGSAHWLCRVCESHRQAAVLESLDQQFGGDPNVADEAGTTPLLVAAKEGKVEIVQALMEKKADLMMADVDGDNPLMVAIAQGHMEIVPCLFFSRGAVCLELFNCSCSLDGLQEGKQLYGNRRSRRGRCFTAATLPDVQHSP